MRQPRFPEVLEGEDDFLEVHGRAVVARGGGSAGEGEGDGDGDGVRRARRGVGVGVGAKWAWARGSSA